MIAFIDDYRDAYGVQPICRALPIAPSTCYEHVAQRQDPSRLSALKPEIARVFAENFAVARCTVKPLVREMGVAVQGSGDAKHRWKGCEGAG